MAFYVMISLGPMIALTIGIAGRALGEAVVRAEVRTRIEALLDPRASEVVLRLLEQGWLASSSTVGNLAILLVLAYGSTAGFAHLRSSLNQIFGSSPQSGAVLRRVRQVMISRAAAFLLVLAVGALLVVLISLRAAAAPAISALLGLSSGARFWLRVGQPVLSLAVLTALFCLVFKMLPERRPPWRAAALGALAAALLFLLGQVVIGLYLGRAPFVSAFGTAGSLVALMLWTYYSCMIVLLGAALAAELASPGPSPADAESS